MFFCSFLFTDMNKIFSMFGVCFTVIIELVHQFMAETIFSTDDFFLFNFTSNAMFNWTKSTNWTLYACIFKPDRTSTFSFALSFSTLTREIVEKRNNSWYSKHVSICFLQSNLLRQQQQQRRVFNKAAQVKSAMLHQCSKWRVF